MDKILELEKNFMKYEYMSNKEYLDNVIDDDYLELGKSGYFFNKKEIIDYLLSQTSDRPIEIYNFSGEEINPGLWIVHYISIHDNKKVYRTSIWRNNKILFHQASELKVDIDLIKS